MALGVLQIWGGSTVAEIWAGAGAGNADGQGVCCGHPVHALGGQCILREGGPLRHLLLHASLQLHPGSRPTGREHQRHTALQWEPDVHTQRLQDWLFKTPSAGRDGEASSDKHPLFSKIRLCHALQPELPCCVAMSCYRSPYTTMLSTSP